LRKHKINLKGGGSERHTETAYMLKQGPAPTKLREFPAAAPCCSFALTAGSRLGEAPQGLLGRLSLEWRDRRVGRPEDNADGRKIRRVFVAGLTRFNPGQSLILATQNRFSTCPGVHSQMIAFPCLSLFDDVACETSNPDQTSLQQRLL
jgi:hypothetical protein